MRQSCSQRIQGPVLVRRILADARTQLLPIVLQVFHVSIPFLGPVLKAALVNSSETRLWRSGPATDHQPHFTPAVPSTHSPLTAAPFDVDEGVH